MKQLIDRLSDEQDAAQGRLALSIGRALDHGEHVPCQTDPAPFDDDSGDPRLCHGCPVLTVCADYARTGAVQHGIMAGRRMKPPDPRWNRRPPAAA